MEVVFLIVLLLNVTVYVTTVPFGFNNDGWLRVQEILNDQESENPVDINLHINENINTFKSNWQNKQTRDTDFISFIESDEQVELTEGDQCLIHRTKGLIGTCRRVSHCNNFSIDGNPLVCGYDGMEPIVCCSETESTTATTTITSYEIHPVPTQSSTPVKVNNRDGLVESKPRISSQKCEEYSQLTEHKLAFSPLIVNPTVVELSVSKCDYSTPLIVGGEKTRPGEFPHMAAIGWNSLDGSVDWNCGGTLISPWYVLTAAHCTVAINGEKPKYVRLGEQNLLTDDDGAKPVDYTITEIIRHPQYKISSYYNDIALFKLDRSVKFTNGIRPACLWQDDKINHTLAVATGWGRTQFGGKRSDDLLKVSLDIVNNTICQIPFENNRRLANGIVNEQLCAGYVQGGKDTCQGDSGGPLQITLPGNQCMFHIIGVTSFGKHCAAENMAGVYTRVSSYLDWIEDIVWRS